MKKLNYTELKDFLNEKAFFYESPSFLDTDPIQIPAQYSLIQDIEISGFLTATISWGNRKSIITNAKKLMLLMGNSPYDFVMNFSEEKHASYLDGFVHRTFNSIDLCCFIIGLQALYKKHEQMQFFFTDYSSTERLHNSIHFFKKEFFTIPHPSRTLKHISDPQKNSAAKRINMFFRWMVRSNDKGVDFGVWDQLLPAQLSCPLDVHSGNVARKLGLLTRKQNDGKALVELDNALRKLDDKDPVKYDFALFGLGVFEKF